MPNGAGFCLPSLQNDRSNLVPPLEAVSERRCSRCVKEFNGIGNCLGVLGNLTCFSYDYAWLPRSAEIPPRRLPEALEDDGLIPGRLGVIMG